MEDTRDIAIEAMSEIKAHIASCDRRYEEYRTRQEQTLVYLKDMTRQISGLSETIAEARGAGKMAKFMAGAVGAGAGFIGGMAHSIFK